jgi:hypothetical protein
MLGFIALVIPLTRWLSMAKESDLKFVAGSVQRAPRWVSTKGGPVIVIRVKMDDGLYDLVQEDLSHSRATMKLKPDDHVTALVKSFFGQYDIWELKHDGVTIESYQDMYLYQTRELERGATNALWFGLVSSIFLTVALALRMYLGAWRDPTPSVPAIQNGSEEADAGPPWHWSIKKKCPKCGSSCYIFDRQCHQCGAQLKSAPLYYWVVGEGLFLSALLIACVKAGMWGGGGVLVLGFIVEGVLRSSARRGTDTAGV